MNGRRTGSGWVWLAQRKVEPIVLAMSEQEGLVRIIVQFLGPDPGSAKRFRPKDSGKGVGKVADTNNMVHRDVGRDREREPGAIAHVDPKRTVALMKALGWI